MLGSLIEEQPPNSPLDIGMSNASVDYDLVVIGSGPAGQKGAIAAAKMNKRVAVIEP